MTQPVIQAIETTVFRLPMFGELRWGSVSALSEVRHVLVRVHLSDGSRGEAEAPPRPTIYGETPHSIVGIIAQELSPRMVGQDPSAARVRMAAIRNNQTARGAVDMALSAAEAQSKGISLAAHLGATRERVPVSYILGIGPLDSVLEEAASVYAQGVRVLKIKVGRDWDEDERRMVALREIGPDLQLYADANECFSVENAPSRLDRLRELGLLYCEEPLPIERIQARAALRQAKRLPIIADDSTFSLRDLERELALDTFDILNIKTARTGYTESMAMQVRAAAQGKGIMVGSQASAGLGTIRAALFAARPGIDHPSELSFFLKLREDILTAPLPIRDGYLTLADVAKAQVDPDRVREAAV